MTIMGQLSLLQPMPIVDVDSQLGGRLEAHAIHRAANRADQAHQ